MEPINNEKNKEMYFVAKKLDIPIFLLSRNRIKYNRIEPMWNYIIEKRAHYTRTCKEENTIETANTKKAKHICGYETYRPKICPNPRILQCSRELIRIQPWHLPPNRYNVLKIPFIKRKGCGGAHWPKKHMHKPLHPPKNIKPQWKFYDLCHGMERLQMPWNRTKGLFLTNARDRRATARCMVSSLIGCYHNPTFPGPCTHFAKNHFMKISPIIKQKLPNPHNFLRNSCVPERQNSIHKRHIGFAPGPGRYDNRFPHNCPCYAQKNRIYQPGLQLMIDKQKRLKFRRLRFIKIKLRKYCTPDWRHVEGKGHTHLFKNIPPKPVFKPRLKINKAAKKGTTEQTVRLYPDARYIGMINDPPHATISHRLEPEPPKSKRIVFNCMSKRGTIRRQLRNNKKIAFNSGQERFKDIERPPMLTASEQEANKNRLPYERQLRDYPVMTRPKSEIQGKLYETPLHMKAAFELQLRKRNFKFLPLPTAKVLVTEADLRPTPDENLATRGDYHSKQLNVMDFLRASIDEKDLQEIQEYKQLNRI